MPQTVGALWKVLPSTGIGYSSFDPRCQGFAVAKIDIDVGRHRKAVEEAPKELYKSLTWDRGKELNGSSALYDGDQHRCLFLRPAKPWQRGRREYQWPVEAILSKGHRLVGAFASPSEQVARQLNERPRETLQFETPAERFDACVASTG